MNSKFNHQERKAIFCMSLHAQHTHLIVINALIVNNCLGIDPIILPFVNDNIFNDWNNPISSGNIPFALLLSFAYIHIFVSYYFYEKQYINTK